MSEHFCESCDRGYKTAELLAAHCATHETCGRDGCRFTAQPKVVLKHVQMQHDTGLYLRIRTENPEDVAKWISERKNRFPTKVNVEKSLARKREMFQRGERIPYQGRPFGRQRDNWRENFNNRSHAISSPTDYSGSNAIYKPTDYPKPKESTRRDSVEQKVIHSQINDKDKWRDFNSWRGALPMFPGTAAFLTFEEEKICCKEEPISDEEEEKESVVKPAPLVKPVVSGVLAALMADYGSDMTEDEDSDETNSKVKDVAQLIQNSPKVENKNTELDQNLSENKEVQLQVLNEHKKSNSFIINPIVTEVHGQKEHNILGDSCQLSAPKPLSDLVKPVRSQTVVDNGTSLRPNIENGTSLRPKIDNETLLNHKIDNETLLNPKIDNETLLRPNVEDSLTSTGNTHESDSGPEEQHIEHKDINKMPVPKAKDDSTKPVAVSHEPSRISKAAPARHRLPRHQLSLLEKLLGSDIRQERNMILQCVRFVIKNNFFDRVTDE